MAGIVCTFVLLLTMRPWLMTDLTEMCFAAVVIMAGGIILDLNESVFINLSC